MTGTQPGSYSGKYVDTLPNRERLFLLEAGAQIRCGQCLYINTIPFRVRNFEVHKEGLLVQVKPVEDAS